MFALPVLVRSSRCFRTGLIALLLAGAALGAAPDDCPPGWYCEPPPEDQAQTPEGEVASESAPQAQGPPPAKAAPEAPEVESSAEPSAESPEESRRTPHPEDERVLLDAPSLPPPAPKPWRRWGAQIRGSLALLSRNRSEDAGAAGLGLGLRYRPTRLLSVEAGLDVYSGRDFDGARRDEFSVSSSLLLAPYVRSSLRPYFLVGAFVAAARARVDAQSRNYTYLGGHLGVGLDYAFSSRFSATTDLVGFLRGRVDPGRDTQPEFVDEPTGRATNASGGGLWRLGLVTYF